MRLPLPPRLRGDTVCLLEARLSRSAHLIPSLRESLDETERARADRFIHAADRDRLTLGRGLARHALGHLMDVPPREIRFGTVGEGKPIVAGGPSFNVSHSGDFVLVATSATGRLGVDVEHARPLPRLESLARTSFVSEEVEAILGLGEAEQEAAFYRIWTRKEAVLKALGHGLTALKSIEVSPRMSGPALLKMSLPGEDLREWTLRSVNLDPEHPAAIALDRPINELLRLPV